MSKLMRYVKGQALVLSVLGVFFILLQSIFDLAQPIFLMLIVDSLVDWKDQWDAFWLNIGLMGAFAVGSLIFGILGSFCGSKASLLVARNIRQGMFSKVQTLSFADIDNVTTSSLITRITNDIQKYQVTLQMILTILIKSPIMFVGGFILAFIINWQLGIVVSGLIVILIVIILIIAFKVVPLFDRAQTELDKSNQIVRENILGMRVVKAFRLQESQQNRFERENTKLRNTSIKAQVLLVLMMPVISLIFQIGIVLILLLAGIQLKNGTASASFIGQIFAFTQILFLILGATIMALLVVINASRSSASITRINAIFNMNPSIVEPLQPQPISKDITINFDHVFFKYTQEAKENVLSDINLTISPGETVGIVGGTGSGKTSLVNLIPRLYDTISGKITIGGIDVRELSNQDLRDKIGVVLQENILFSGTIQDNLKYGNLQADKNLLDEACSNACALDFIEELPLRYDAPVEQRGRNFSGGQKQRLSIARTLVKKPQILILDDTTSALDMITEATVQKNIKKNLKGSTVIIVAQRISAVKDADKILVLDDGKISGIGTHENLIKSNDIYRMIVRSQLGEEGLK